MKNIVAIVAVGVLLAACANKAVWYRDGATQQDFYMDQGQCKAQGFSVASGSLLQAAMVFNSCMQGKGWSLVRPGDVSPTSVPASAPQRDDLPFLNKS